MHGKEIYSGTWRHFERPSFELSRIYVQNDQFAILRKAMVDGYTIQFHEYTNNNIREWKDHDYPFEIGVTEKRLRIKPEENNEYPIFKRWGKDGEICKFTTITDRVVVLSCNTEFKIGEKLADSVPHTIDGWEYVPYNRERDLWHGQPIRVWEDDIQTHSRTFRFYDIYSDNAFSPQGKIRGMEKYKNIQAVQQSDYKAWHIESYATLELEG